MNLRYMLDAWALGFWLLTAGQCQRLLGFLTRLWKTQIFHLGLGALADLEILVLVARLEGLGRGCETGVITFICTSSGNSVRHFLGNQLLTPRRKVAKQKPPKVQQLKDSKVEN